MGFYGNIQNSNKVSLQFDLVYPNRFQMDIGVGTDGVFLGRYVAIDYGEMPIVGYYNSEDGNFYTVRDNQTADTRITPKPNAIYQDITSDTTTLTNFFRPLFFALQKKAGTFLRGRRKTSEIVGAVQ